VRKQGCRPPLLLRLRGGGGHGLAARAGEEHSSGSGSGVIELGEGERLDPSEPSSSRDAGEGGAAATSSGRELLDDLDGADAPRASECPAAGHSASTGRPPQWSSEGRIELLEDEGIGPGEEEDTFADPFWNPSVQYFLTRCPSGKADKGLYIGSCRWFLGTLVEEALSGEVDMQTLRKVLVTPNPKPKP
jgi:hypothetical protein